MESTRFDNMTRRMALKTVGAAGLGLGLARLGLDSAAAGKKKKKVTERCKSSDQCGAGLVCKRANSQNYYPKTEERCCRPVGESCDQGIDCCGVDVICNGGICQKA